MRATKVLLAALIAITSLSVVNCANQGKHLSGLRTVYFDFDKAFIRSDQIPVMDGNADALKYHNSRSSEKGAHTNYRRKSRIGNVVVSGHCDERGTNEYNYALGHRRAEAVKSYLVTKGINPSRLRTTSYGEDRGTCKSSTEDCWAQNRRAEFERE